ncbi:hypothetical protein F5B19DRAFT_472776 [Rostrohypoxylon terebratum]|nr:hypothetical protein F5B19DRAFT_472776 [Rostrohypoxylon terebratum]
MMEGSKQVDQEPKQADSRTTEPESASQSKGATLSSLATERLEQQILQRPSTTLQDRCVFYTSVPTKEEDQEEYKERKNIESDNIYRGLSLIALAWAASNDRVTIWTIVPLREDEISGESRYAEYEENMTRAMARHCSGTVYIMSMRPKQLSKYKDIWGNIAYPELLARFSAGQDRAPTKLISVDAVNPHNQFLLDWNTQEVQKGVEPADPDFLKLGKRRVHSKDTCNCTANLKYELPGQDWFG